jgi:transcriptional regulator GlxA family with amidase domain
MKHISILIPQGHFSLVNVEGTHQMLSSVNEILQASGKKPLFEIHLTGFSKNITQSGGLFTIHPEFLLEEIHKTDMIILPAIHGNFQENLEKNAALIPWIIKHYRQGAEVVSLCIGSFLLASTGLLNGKPCATHWRFAGDFKRMFPEIQLTDDKIITEADGIYTSGGAYSFTNLLIYLIEKYAGRDIAVMTAKTFMIDIDHNSQSPFIIFTGQKTHQDEAVLNAQAYIEQHFREKITVDELCENFGVSRRTFERRFKKATSNTIVEYIQRVKIEAAKKQFETTEKNVSEIMYDTGYTDAKAFRDVFKKVTNMSPGDYRHKYKQRVAPLYE